MEAADSFDRCLRELGVYLKSEEAQVGVAFPEHVGTIGVFYLDLWHLSNSLSAVFRLATGDPRAEKNIEAVATSIIRFVEHFKAATRNAAIIDLPRAVHSPEGVRFMSTRLPSHGDVLLDLAHNVMRTLAAIDDPEKCDRAEQACLDNPLGLLQYDFAPIAVAEKWGDYRGNVVKFLLRWLRDGFYYDPNEPPPDQSLAPPTSLDARALAAFIEHPDWTNVQIAKAAQCNAKSLTRDRCPKFFAAKAAYTAKAAPRGSKDRDSNLEAWDEG